MPSTNRRNELINLSKQWLLATQQLIASGIPGTRINWNVEFDVAENAPRQHAA